MYAVRLVRAVVSLAVVGALAACTGDDDDPKDEAEDTPTCTQDVVNSGDESFRIEPTGKGGPHLDRNLLVDTYPRAGHLCADIVIDHADTGADATGFTIIATQGDKTWRQQGTDPDDQPALRVDATGCVDFVATLTVTGAGDREYDYRAQGRFGIDCER